MRFIPGQRVKVIKVDKDGNPKHVGQHGKIMTATPFGYKVLLDTWDEEAIFFEGELGQPHSSLQSGWEGKDDT